MLERLKKIFSKEQKDELTISDKMENLFNDTFCLDLIRLEIGEDIVTHGDEICEKIWDFRNKIAKSYGFILPNIHVIDNSELQENEIKLFLQEKEILNDFWVVTKENCLDETERLLNILWEDHLEDIFSNEFLEKILSSCQIDNGWLIWNITNMYTMWDIKNIFINILKQKKSIKNSILIFEKLSEYKLSNCWQINHKSCEKIAKKIVEIL